jgi:hypothetical protein
MTPELPTPESIAAARMAQQRDRAAVTADTGVTFAGDRLVLPDPYERLAHVVASAIWRATQRQN